MSEDDQPCNADSICSKIFSFKMFNQFRSGVFIVSIERTGCLMSMPVFGYVGLCLSVVLHIFSHLGIVFPLKMEISSRTLIVFIVRCYVSKGLEILNGLKLEI